MGGDDDDVLSAGNQVHSAAHAGNHLAGDDVGGQGAFLIDLQGAQNGSIHMTAADQTEGGSGIEEHGAGNGGDVLAASVGHVGVLVFLGSGSAHTHNAVLRLENHMNIFRQIVGDHLGHTDAQVDNITIMQEASSALRNDNLCVFH